MVLAAVLLAAGAAAFGWMRLSKKTPKVATLQVERSEFLDALEFRGEIKAMKSVEISAPPNAGMLQILKIAPNGSEVKAGDVVVQFDPSRTTQDLAQDNSALKSAQAAIEEARAQSKLTEEGDRTAVMKAGYDVDSARLDASKNEILSRIEGAEANLKVDDARQALAEAEAKLKSDVSKGQATTNSKEYASKKARFDRDRAAQTLASLTLRAPIAGVVSLLPVWHNGSEHPFRAGEQAWSGSPIAEIPDASTLRIIAHVDETQRGRLAVGQAASIQLDAISNRQFTGKVESIGTIATMDFSAGWPFPRNFKLSVSVDQKDPRLKPGMTAQITIVVEKIPNAVSIPVQATFLRAGRTVAYVWDGSKFDEREIRVQRRSRDRALIARGLKPGEVIALQDPSVKE
ncbi:MAG: efflux RND transporter periplasmic adaptor subunit [Acidobacteriota bacterium]